MLAPVIALVALAIRPRLWRSGCVSGSSVWHARRTIVVHKFRTFRPAVDADGRLLPEFERASTLAASCAPFDLMNCRSFMMCCVVA